MPWGSKLPVVKSSNGRDLIVAPKSSTLDGVHLVNVTDISTIAALVYNALNLPNEATLPDGIETRLEFPVLEEAASAIGKVQRLVTDARRGEQLLVTWESYLELALHNPFEDIEGLANLVLSMEDDLRMAKDIEIADGTEYDEEDPEDIDDDSNTPYDYEKQLELNPSYDLRKKLLHPNHPPASGEWSFIPGTDFEPAKLDTPNAGKFTFHRMQQDDEDAWDCREFPQIKHFDWTCPLSIERLNKWRAQMIQRTQGKRQEPPKPWTDIEKEILANKVSEKLALGTFKSKTELFKSIAAEMKEELKDTVQPKGTKIVSTSKLVKGQTVFKVVRERKLTEDRTGFNRDWKTISNKAHEFSDIKAVIEACLQDQKKSKTPRNKKSEKSVAEKRKRDDAEDEEIEADTKEATPVKPKTPVAKRFKIVISTKKHDSTSTQSNSLPTTQSRNMINETSGKKVEEPENEAEEEGEDTVSEGED